MSPQLPRNTVPLLAMLVTPIKNYEYKGGSKLYYIQTWPLNSAILSLTYLLLLDVFSSSSSSSLAFAEVGRPVLFVPFPLTHFPLGIFC